MRQDLRDHVGKLLDTIPPTGKIKLSEDETEAVLDLADLISRARSPIERDYKGEPLYAHALEAPTRLAKQLVQIGRGGLALGMPRQDAMGTVARCAADTMPPMRRDVLLDVAAHQGCFTTEVIKRLQVPRKTVDRTLQELQLLGLLVVADVQGVHGTRWAYSLAPDISRPALERLAGNVSRGTEESQP
jgi:hypothetical protein